MHRWKKTVSVWSLILLLGTGVYQDLSAEVPAAAQSPVSAETYASVPGAPDYSESLYWARLPQEQRHPVDVFYVYPTVFKEKSAAVENMDLQNAALRRLADVQVGINEGVFSPSADVFAPHYRQASIGILNAPEAEQDRYLRPGYEDVARAFEYYLAHYNHGRPFILAGFSQGSMALLELMKKRFNDSALQEKLVAAYLIGYSVTAQDVKKFPWLKMARRETDTGVIVSYNTQLAGSGYSYVLRPGALGINPVNWRTDGRTAPQKAHKGAVLFDIRTGEKEAEIAHFSAVYREAETGALIVSADPDVYSINQPLFPAGVMHMYDYMFFYNNLTENVARRIAAWTEENKK